MELFGGLGGRGKKPRKLSPAQFGLVAIVVAIVLGLVVQAMRGPEAPVDEATRLAQAALVEKFDQLAFHPEASPDQPLERVRKWKGRVRILLADELVDFHVIARRHADLLATLTGLDLTLLETGDGRENLLVRLVEEIPDAGSLVDDPERAGSIERQLARQGCAHGISPADAGLVTGAEIWIRRDIGERRQIACLIEEMTQSLGLPGYSNDLPPSIFHADEHYLADLSVNDRLLVAALYDARIRPGMSRRRVQSEISEIFADLLRD